MMMKTKYLLCLIFAASLLVLSCGDDDKPEDPVEMTDDDGGMTDDGTTDVTLSEAQDETAATLTNGTKKTWRISQATLNNSSASFDISNNFNVVDDEFLFSGTRTSGSLEWRPGNDIGVEGTTSQETLLDFYKAPETSSFTFNAESSTELTGLDGRLTFTVVDENTINGTLIFGNRASGETIDLTLTTKLISDYAVPPASGLNFTEITSFMAYRSFAQQSNSGLVGSYSDNSLYIAYRNDCNTDRSRVMKYDIDNNSFVSRDDSFTDFFTRRLNIVNNQLILTGGINIYTYDLDISSPPAIAPHNAGNLSRFSTANLNNDVYVTGGDLDGAANKLRKINSATGNLDVVATLPTPKVHAGSEIINDNLYIFSGREEFFENAGVSTVSYIYNLVDGSFQSFQTPVALNNSFASKFQNLIYVVGDVQIDTDADGTVDDINVWTGVYDTETNQMTEIVNNLDDSDFFSYIHSMTVFNNNMYITYGDSTRNDPDDNCAEFPWSVMVAPIN
tara:strand:- start:218 stop:1732 length:1515 start_codon:yes stop_codon:yes gene_type:complete